MKALLIDTPNKRVVEVEYNGDYRTIKEHIHADLFTTVLLDHNGDTIFLDDEGLINGNPHGWFEIDTYHQPLRGYGLVLGTDEEGASVAPRTTLEALSARLSFPEDGERPEPESYAGFEVQSFDSADDFLKALFGARA